MNEFDLIRRYLGPLASSGGARGLLDDAAVWTPPAGSNLVIVADTIVEGVHFLSSEAHDWVAARALRVNLSDIAAKGARPEAYLLCITWPKSAQERDFALFAEGLARDQVGFGLTLLGGDTTRANGPLTVSVTVFGIEPVAGSPSRAGAQAGDDVYVSGTIGDAGLGLALARREEIRSDEAAELVQRYRRPEPKLALGVAIAPFATASIDVSDGLVADLGHIATASDVDVLIGLKDVPFSQAALNQSNFDPVRAITAGDDYEIAFTAPPERRGDVAAAALSSDTPITRIGHVERCADGSTGEVRCRAGDGELIKISTSGFSHF